MNKIKPFYILPDKQETVSVPAESNVDYSHYRKIRESLEDNELFIDFLCNPRISNRAKAKRSKQEVQKYV